VGCSWNAHQAHASCAALSTLSEGSGQIRAQPEHGMHTDLPYSSRNPNLFQSLTFSSSSLTLAVSPGHADKYDRPFPLMIMELSS
jgi:hypothetical protein